MTEVVHPPVTKQCTVRLFSNESPICFASANVCSLHANSKYCGDDFDIKSSCSRLAIIEEMFNSAEFDIVGVQEGRFKVEQQIAGQHFHIHAAAANERGCYGCQVWLRNSFKHSVIASIVSNPRLITVVVKPDSYTSLLGIIAAHGPHAGDDHQVITDFWSMVTYVIGDLRSKFQGISIALLTDANARTGSVPSSFIGSFNCEKENYPGQCFRVCIESCELQAVNKYFASHPFMSTEQVTTLITCVFLVSWPPGALSPKHMTS